MTQNEETVYCYAYVGKRIRDEIKYGVIELCPKCKSRTIIQDVNKWRNTGAGLICNVCSGAKPGQIVANDNYEVLKLKSKYKVEIPDRFKTKAQ